MDNTQQRYLTALTELLERNIVRFQTCNRSRGPAMFTAEIEVLTDVCARLKTEGVAALKDDAVCRILLTQVRVDPYQMSSASLDEAEQAVTQFTQLKSRVEAYVLEHTDELIDRAERRLHCLVTWLHYSRLDAASILATPFVVKAL